MTERNFHFDIELEAFEKSGVAPEKSRRIGGFVSTGAMDKQQERILQDGLDFSPFLKDGWFNDNHSKDTADIVGFPENAKLIRKGEQLPSGALADKTGWFVEGYLLQGHPPADKIWNLAQSLQKTPRRLGFSVEGKVTQRLGKSDGTITKAIVRNVAITNCPVNPETALEVLAKSMTAVEKMSKALECGTPANNSKVPAGVGLSGEGAGRVLMSESIGTTKKKKKKKKLTKSEALSIIQRRFDGVSKTVANRIYQFALNHAQA